MPTVKEIFAETQETHGLQMKYFILKPGGTGPYAQASRKAMLEFANVIERENAVLATDLREWVATTFAQELSQMNDD